MLLTFLLLLLLLHLVGGRLLSSVICPHVHPVVVVIKVGVKERGEEPSYVIGPKRIIAGRDGVGEVLTADGKIISR